MFFIELAYKLEKDIYPSILEIQCFLFYKRINENNKFFGMLYKKEKLFCIIKEIISSILRNALKTFPKTKKVWHYKRYNKKYKIIKWIQFFLEENNIYSLKLIKI